MLRTCLTSCSRRAFRCLFVQPFRDYTLHLRCLGQVASPSRYLHTTIPNRSACDFGSPCQCSECRQSARRPICEVCKKNPTEHQSSYYSVDRKGIGDYFFTSYCSSCWEEHIERVRQASEERKRRRAELEQSKENMLNTVRETETGENVPIKYAVDKSMASTKSTNSYKWHMRHLLYFHGEDLAVQKVKNRWICSKARADAMDFELWWKRSD